MQHGSNETSPVTTPLANTLMASKEIYYQVPWRVRGVQAGSHRTTMRGSGSDFSAFVSLLTHPDPKRLDVRASLKTVPRQLMVRTFFERSAIHAYVVNDLSSSMRYSGTFKKDALLAEIAQSIAWSVVRQGDYFSMVSCNDTILEEVSVALTHRKSASSEVYSKLSRYFLKPLEGQKTATAIPLSANKVGPKKSLVFIISDFYWTDALLHQTLHAFSMHDVVPIVLWDQTEFEALPEWGWAKFREIETGLQRSLFMRPTLHLAMREYAMAKKKALCKVCQQHGARLPFFVKNGFDASALSRHLLEN